MTPKHDGGNRLGLLVLVAVFSLLCLLFGPAAAAQAAADLPAVLLPANVDGTLAGRPGTRSPRADCTDSLVRVGKWGGRLQVLQPTMRAALGGADLFRVRESLRQA